MNNSTWSGSLGRFVKKICSAFGSGRRNRRNVNIDVHTVSKRGQLHSSDGTPNQDNEFGFVVEGGRNDRSGAVAAGVFDGHGAEGHLASGLACEIMERGFETGLDGLGEQETGLVGLLQSLFKETAVAIGRSPCGTGSGTTASVVAVREKEAVVAWVGDSVIAVIADAAPSSPAHIRFASSMHRVADPGEADRVRMAGGNVRDGYVTDPDGRKGIAVTRTLGDIDMHQYGCTSDPQTAVLKLQERDVVIVIASDGLWDTEGVTADAMLRIASRRRGRTAKRICQNLMRAAEREGGPSDDCTIVCVTVR